MTSRWLLAGSALILVGGCASDSEPAATDALATSRTANEATITTETATATVETTTTLTPTSTAAPTTTLAPTTTVDPLDELAAEIERDLNLGEQALLAAVADPDNQELRRELGQYYSGTSLQLARDTLDVLVADGLLGRPNLEVPSVVRLRKILEKSPDSETVPTHVELCRVDAGVIYEPLEDGEIIVNDRINVTLSTSRVYLVDDIWVLDGGTLLEQLGPEDRCD